MMASKVLSRFLPGAESIFHSPEVGTPGRQRILEEAQEPTAEERYNDLADDQELDDMLLEAQEEDDVQRPLEERHLARGMASPGSAARTSRVERRHEADLPDDNDVPASLFMDARPIGPDEASTKNHNTASLYHQSVPRTSEPASPYSPTERLSDSRAIPRSPLPTRRTARTAPLRINRRERALWRWANVENVDGFLLQVYHYYADHGIWSVLLSRTIHVLTTAFLFSAYIFLSSCIDYSKVPHSKSTSEILIPRCMAKTSFSKNVLIWVFIFWWSWTIFRYITDINRLWQLHDFYHYLLDIPDSDVQSVAWERVVEALMSLRDANPETASNTPSYLRKAGKTTQSKQRMDAHDIANRLMRRDNYYIALINKEILDLELTIPFVGRRNFYSKSLEWCISFCFENFIFDGHGHVQQHCLDPKLRLHVIETMRRRFRFAAVISILMAPLNISAQCILFFSRYYAEFRNAPSQLGARAFTPLAEWKMRDFNELEHDFRRRTKMAYPFADRYLAQFPRDKTIQFLQFVSLVAGTIAAVLGVATLLDPELFLGFEITPNRTAFFYLSVSMGIFATARSAVPDDGEVHDPVLHLIEVIDYTHYSPQRWRNKFHTPAVRTEFSVLYQMKVLIFLDELLSLVAAPFILWRNAGRPSTAIVDFFRQNTVHVSGLGGLCNHAVFEFRKRTRPEDDDVAVVEHDDELYGTSVTGRRQRTDHDNKMAQSQYYFMQRLGRYERGVSAEHRYGHLAARHGRTQHGPTAMAMPPSFPPLTQLHDDPRQRVGGVAAAAAAAAGVKTSPALTGTAPHKSTLLDLHGTTAAGAAAAAAAAGGRRRRRASDRPAGRDLELGPDEVDLTTSKLIEADRSLADSWKFDEDEDNDDGDHDGDGGRFGGRQQRDQSRGLGTRDGKRAGGGGGGAVRAPGEDRGVVGLLVEYTKAHQAIVKKGGRIT